MLFTVGQLKVVCLCVHKAQLLSGSEMSGEQTAAQGKSCASYLSLFGVCAELTLQTGDQPLVRVVRHQTHQLHPPLDLWAQIKTESRGDMGPL